MEHSVPDQITKILDQIGEGDRTATARLLPAVYQELRRLAPRSCGRLQDLVLFAEHLDDAPAFRISALDGAGTDELLGRLGRRDPDPQSELGGARPEGFGGDGRHGREAPGSRPRPSWE